MFITKLTASFGGLQQQTLTLEPGLNVVEAPNEWGKSTWSAFLVAMLYGLDKSKRDRKDALSEKNQYQPWSGAPMEGALECVTAEGKSIRLERKTKRATAPMGQFSATDLQTGEPVVGLTGDNVGLTLLGVERDVFERSAFVRQSRLAVTQTPELERRIASMVSSGEDISWSETDGRLNQWKNRRKHNRTGLLPELNARLAQVEQALETVRQSRERRLAAQEQLEAIGPRKEAVSRQLRQWETVKQSNQARKKQAAQADWAAASMKLETLRAKQKQLNLPGPPALRQGQAMAAALLSQRPALEQAEEKTKEVEQALFQRRQAADAGMFGEQTPEAAFLQAQTAAQRCKELEKRAVFRPWVFALLCFVVFGAIAAVVIISLQSPGIVTALALSGAALISALLPIILLVWYRRRTGAMAEKRSLLKRYGVEQPEEILEQAAAYQEEQRTLTQLEVRLEEAVAARDAQRTAARAGRTQLLALVGGFAPETETVEQAQTALEQGLAFWSDWERACMEEEALHSRYEAIDPAPEGTEPTAEIPQITEQQLQMELAQLEERERRLSEQIAMAKGEQAVGGDPDGLDGEREQLLEQRSRLEAEYDALVLAQSVLQEAHAEMRARFSPVLNERAGQWMARFTNGKYQDLMLDREFAANVRTGMDPVSRSALALSTGTTDQLYLAVRLAICELALPEAVSVPLVLDDILVQFDQMRMEHTLDALLQEQRQILLFTCHRREGAYLEGRPGVSVQRMSV